MSTITENLTGFPVGTGGCSSTPTSGASLSIDPRYIAQSKKYVPPSWNRSGKTIIHSSTEDIPSDSDEDTSVPPTSSRTPSSPFCTDQGVSRLKRHLGNISLPRLSTSSQTVDDPRIRCQQSSTSSNLTSDDPYSGLNLDADTRSTLDTLQSQTLNLLESSNNSSQIVSGIFKTLAEMSLGAEPQDEHSILEEFAGDPQSLINQIGMWESFESREDDDYNKEDDDYIRNRVGWVGESEDSEYVMSGGLG